MRAVALLVLLVVLSPTFAQAQHRGGGGRLRDGQVRSQEEGPDSIGKYGLRRTDVLEVVSAGEGAPALEAYQRAAAEAEQKGKLGTAARAGAAAVLVAARLGMLQTILTLAPHVMDVAGKAPTSQEVAKAMVNTAVSLSGAHLAVNEHAQAHAVLETALTYSRSDTAAQYRRAMVGPIASLLERLSSIELAQDDCAGALAHAEEAVQLIEASLGERRRQRGVASGQRQVAWAYLQVARVATAGHQPDAAAAALAKATELARLVGLAHLTADVALQSAQLALQLDHAAEALQLALAARAEADRAGLADQVGDADRILALANARVGHTEAALAAAERALARIENARASLRDPASRAGFLEQRQDLYSFAVHLALDLNRPDEALVLAERGRSRAFLDLLGNASLSKGRTRALAQEESALRARLAEARLGRGDELDEEDEVAAAKAARDRVASVEREYQAFLRRVRKESVEQASLMAVEPVTAAEIQALLPPGSVLIEYFLSGRDLVIWVLDGASLQARRVRRDRDAIVAELRDFRAAIASQAPLAQVEARAQALYQTLIGPVEPLIRGKRLVIVPHDVLHYLPFSALRSPDGRWLVEEHAFTTVPSASVLKFLVDKGPQASDRILAVGNPDLGPALALPWAEREVRALGERYPTTSTVLVRADASESRVKQQAGQAGLIHFAVHGDLNETDPMASALLLDPGKGEDGRFEVREIFSTELSAKLVVLSACETGLGKLSRGDELVGLQRAFLYAGTPAVVTTLWKVDDRASFLLMRRFYEGLEAKGPAQALRAAQRSLIVDYPHPFWWAGYGLTGAAR